MYYTRLQVVCQPDFAEILMAEVAEAGFDTFMESEQGFEAFGEETVVNKTLLDDIQVRYAHVQPLLFFSDRVERQNWNEEWEKNVDPVVVADRCLIRASFHKIDRKYPYEIIITPKMSFGTGHHQTTHLMIQAQMELDHQGKLVMDAGCGTAVLSIMASKLGATSVEAFDVDDWSVPNGAENCDVNRCPNVRVRQGKITDFVWEQPFDIILANINKNILLDELGHYAAHLKPGGHLLLSGFFDHDIPDLLKKSSTLGFGERRRYTREDWAALLLEKQS
ncbi:MAG: 50S ribosomal protein L11 methyltransferase [Cyclobacteriaceae bacterium]|nr:50S ribosomal protein L11 methyltransferase [Cyclobacteriaceae bacterium]